MSKGTFAKEELMEDYLSSLLTEEPEASEVVAIAPAPANALLLQPEMGPDVEQERLAKLLEEASLNRLREETADVAMDTVDGAQQVKENLHQVEIELSDNSIETEQDQGVKTAEFQALFFNVAGLTLALPLTELGGIHKLEKVGPLFGKPEWFMGVMLHRDENLSVVDSAKWVMPEKYDEKLAESLNYQYLIMLDDSGWGLACESLITTTALQPDDVKWREAHGKRPWLAGMVKEKMCALINVQQLIKLLDKGLGSNDK